MDSISNFVLILLNQRLHFCTEGLAYTNKKKRTTSTIESLSLQRKLFPYILFLFILADKFLGSSVDCYSNNVRPDYRESYILI